MDKRVGKLSKLKSVLKRWNSFNNKHSHHSITTVDNDSSSSSPLTLDLRPVYVGKSRRRYLVSSDVFEHPF
ncbi:putative small auxin-up RNA [Lupinus albus]|uniref:Putative small auxin-up RNA n=1 Tax=Lupinus albus TaxID=3870 RepID=A0A6A4PTM2_LUPAL|nr:putative small auxin-up RNA [Lupinus albus]